jgi:hypothetical protein
LISCKNLVLWFGHPLGESKRFIPKIHGWFMQDAFITKWQQRGCLEFQSYQLTLRYCLFFAADHKHVSLHELILDIAFLPWSKPILVEWITLIYCLLFFSSFCSRLKTMGLLLATLVKDGHKINRSCVLLHVPVKNFHQLWVWWMMHDSDSLWGTYLKRKF